MNSPVKIGVSLLTFGVLLFGCSEAEQATIEATPVANVPAASQPASEAQLAKQGEPTPDATAAENVSAQSVQFTPPFPQRVQLFEPPQRQNMARRDDEHGETVELKGFIDVGEQRVVLSIDGVIASVPEGGEKYGVQVISIEPPTVVLQRGRNRWPATLE